jgi:hypothetical protein
MHKTSPPPQPGNGKNLNVSNETVYKWIEQRGMPGLDAGGCSNNMRLMTGFVQVVLLIQIKVIIMSINKTGSMYV